MTSWLPAGPTAGRKVTALIFLGRGAEDGEIPRLRQNMTLTNETDGGNRDSLGRCRHTGDLGLIFKYNHCLVSNTAATSDGKSQSLEKTRSVTRETIKLHWTLVYLIKRQRNYHVMAQDHATDKDMRYRVLTFSVS